MATADTIKQYFVNILQRDPTAAESAQYTGAVDTGALTLTQVRDALASSAEATTYVDQIIRIYQAAFGRKPDVTGIDGWTDQLRADPTALSKTAAGFVNSTEWKNRYGDNTVNDAVLQALYVNVLGRVGSGDEINAWKATGQSMTQILIGFSNSQEFINKSASAVMAIKKAAGDVATADLKNVYTGSGALFDPSQGSGGSFTLTPGTDYADGSSSFKNGGLISSDFKFTANNETVTAGAGSLQAADILIDVSTTDNDTLNATLTSGTVLAPTLQNIENINLTSTVAASGLSLANVTGAKTVTVTGSASSKVAGVSNTATPAFVVSNYNSAVEIEMTALAGTTANKDAEVLNLTVSGTGSKSSITVSNAGVAGTLETVNLVSGGTAANVTSLVAGANTTFETVNVTGGQALTLKTAGDAINNVKLAATNTGGTMLDIDFDGGDLVNLGNMSGINSLVLRDSAAPGGEGYSLFNVASGSTITAVTDAANAVVTVKGSAASTTDTLTFVLKSDATTATDVDYTSITANNVETINIVSDGAPTTGANKQNSIGTLNADALKAMAITGASEFSVKFGAIAQNIAVDGSKATGALSIDANAVTGAASGSKTLSLSGGDKADVLIGADADGVATTFTGGAGNDTFAINLGNTNGVITDFANGDKIAMSTAGTVGAVAGTFVNALGLTAGQQAAVEATGTLALAVDAVNTALGGIAVNTAVAFTWQGNQYVFMNEATVNAYDAASDAIVQVTGLTSASTLTDSAFLFVA